VLVVLVVVAAPADTVMTMVVVTGMVPVGVTPMTSPLGLSEATCLVVMSRKPCAVRSERTMPADCPR